MQGEVILCPVRKNRAVASVSDEFFWELGDLRVKVVHDIVDDAGSFYASGGVPVVGVSLHWVLGPQPIHVDVSVSFELMSKLAS